MILQSQRSNLIIITYFIIYSFFIQNINSKLFPSDFFEPILPQKDGISTNKEDSDSFQKEYEEDKELLDLLTSSKSKRNLYII